MQGQSGGGHAACHSCREQSFAAFPESALETTLHGRFATQVRAHRDCLALVDGNRRLSYARLDAWSNSIAHVLAEAGVRHGDRVGLLLPQGAGAVAAILGVLKAGAAFAPLDPAEPPSRVARTAAAAELCAVVATRSGTAAGCPAVVLPGPDAETGEPPQSGAGPDSVAYVYFTSGSTGEPKGVVDTHRNVLHNVLRYTNTLRLSPCDRLTLIQSPTFSGTVSSLFSALCNGAAVYPFRLAEDGIARLASLIRTERLTVYHSVPAIFRALTETGGTFPDVRIVRLEGDSASSLDVAHHRRSFAFDSVLVNGLGTTETGLVRQFFVGATTDVDDGPLPLGYAVPGVEVVVVGDDGRPLSQGCIGEIAVVSRYLALGYYGRPDLTAKGFTDTERGRTYRTGDLGRLRDDGCLEHHGRIDFVAKVGGVRIDTAEIEAGLLAIDEIREAVVATRETTTGRPRLVAWIVTADGAAPDVSGLRRRLAETLPAASVPAAFVTLDALPLTGQGKVAHDALPEPRIGSSRGPAPADDLERRIVGSWEHALGIAPIGLDDSFFDLGGDSLAAAQILAELERDTGRELPPATLLAAPTVALLAELVRAGPVEHAAAVPLRADGARPPLFLAHCADGTVPYGAYASLLRDRPLWGLQSALDVVRPLRFEEKAAALVAAMRDVQPHGPYHLGGYCFGGVLAFEMAHQLAASNEHVAMLALVGVSPFDFPLAAPEARRRYLRSQGYEPVPLRVWHTLGRIRRAGPRGGARIARSAARTMPAYLGVRRGRVPAPAADAVATIDDANRWAFAGYRPRTYPGRCVLILSDETTRKYTSDPLPAWAGLATEVTVHSLPGVDDELLDSTAHRVVSILEDELARDSSGAMSSSRFPG